MFDLEYTATTSWVYQDHKFCSAGSKHNNKFFFVPFLNFSTWPNKRNQKQVNG